MPSNSLRALWFNIGFEDRDATLTCISARLSCFVSAGGKVGGRFTAGGGWIDGMNVELVKDKLIVQAWRGNDDDWPKGYYSAVRFLFTKVLGGARLDFLHSGVPATAYDMIRDGWLEYHWGPLKRTFQK